MQQHVQRLLDVVRVELLFEVDDIVAFLVGTLLGRCSRSGYRYRDNIQRVLFYEKHIVDIDVDLGHRVDFEVEIVIFEIDLFYEIGLVEIEIVVVGHHGLPGSRASRGWRARTIAPGISKVPDLTRPRCRVFPGRRVIGRRCAGPRRPLGPLFCPAGRADGLFQRSLLGLLDPLPRLPATCPTPSLSRGGGAATDRRCRGY